MVGLVVSHNANDFLMGWLVHIPFDQT